jgi:hypothetical protein
VKSHRALRVAFKTFSFSKTKARFGEWNRALSENIRISGESLLSKRGRRGRFRPNPVAPAALGCLSVRRKGSET